MKEPLLCPSAPVKKGLDVFAYFDDKKDLQYLEETEPITVVMIDELKLSSTSTSLRAAMPCATKGCINWDGSRCSVPDQMNYLLKEKIKPNPILSCAIRTSCRWYAQEGIAACSICPLVVTDFIELEDYGI